MVNEKRLIDANVFWESVSTDYWEHFTQCHTTDQIDLMEMVEANLAEQPTVDAVEVVRCKDCKHWLPEELERCKALKQEPYGLCNMYPQRTDWQDTTDHDDFCSYGERRTK